MNGGRNLGVVGDFIEKYFTTDKFGALHPNPTSLRTELVGAKVTELLAHDKQLGRDLTRRIFSTDVEFAYRPLGSTPVIANGISMFGPSPLRRMSFTDKIGGASRQRANNEFLAKCKRREKKISSFIQDAVDTVESFEPTDEVQEVLKEIEQDQVLTGGGYDNTEMWGVSKSLLTMLGGSDPEISQGDDARSQILMEEIMKFRERFHQQLSQYVGKLTLTSFEIVRLMQESDGMLGFPVMAKTSKVLTKSLARTISMWSGVDCRGLVNTLVKGEIAGGGTEMRKATVVDAMCYCMDRMITDPGDDHFAALIWTLARIQRHGYKVEDGELTAKAGKSRSVSPNAAFSAAEEAMSADAFLKAMKDAKIPWMPSLQDRETADTLIWDWYEKVLVPKNMRPLPLDWSKWDHHMYGWILATILYYCVRPLYTFESQKWFDLAIVSLVFKYYFVNVEATEALPEEWAKVQQRWGDNIVRVSDDFYIVGAYDFLGSGAKLTHVGGSLYGELLIHHCVPRQLGFEGVDGPQAGDDTAVAVPVEMINLDSSDATFKPIVDAAAYWGLEMNAAKQIWVIGAGEVMNIFLQYAYNYNLQIRGVGTGARYYVAYPFAEREKALSIGEQYMAIISKFANGYNNPWIRIWIKKWLERDKYALSLFHFKGEEAFDILVESIGTSLTDISKRLELTYNWGLKPEQLESRDIPILGVIVEVAAELEPIIPLHEALSKLQALGEGTTTDDASDVEFEDQDDDPGNED